MYFLSILKYLYFRKEFELLRNLFEHCLNEQFLKFGRYCTSRSFSGFNNCTCIGDLQWIYSTILTELEVTLWQCSTNRYDKYFVYLVTFRWFEERCIIEILSVSRFIKHISQCGHSTKAFMVASWYCWVSLSLFWLGKLPFSSVKMISIWQRWTTYTAGQNWMRYWK